MSGYAKGTTVPPSRTRAKIEDELEKRGASAFGYNRDGRRNVIAFTLDGLQVRMELEAPDPADFPDRRAANGRVVSGEKEYDEEVRRRWRALLLVVKAKLIAVDDGITTLEREFLADVVTPAGSTVMEEVRPAIEQARRASTNVREFREIEAS